MLITLLYYMYYIHINHVEQILNKRVKENYPDISTDVYNRKFYTFYTKTLPVIDYYENQGKVIRINGNGELHSIYSNMYKIISDLQFERPVSSETPPSYAVKKSSSRVSTSSTKISSRRHSAHSINSSKESLSKRRSSKSLSHSKSKLNNRKNSFKNVFFVIGKLKFYIIQITSIILCIIINSSFLFNYC